jgi:hypothetical protein
MLGRVGNGGFIHALLVKGHDLRFMGGTQPLIKEIAFGEELLAGILACILQKLADLDGSQSQQKGKIGLGKQNR